MVDVGQDARPRFVRSHPGGSADAFGVSQVVASLNKERPHGKRKVGSVERGSDVASKVSVTSLDGVLIVRVGGRVAEVDLMKCAPSFPIGRAESFVAIRKDFLNDVSVLAKLAEEVGHDEGSLGRAAGAGRRGDNELGGGARCAEDVLVTTDAGLERTAVVNRDLARGDDFAGVAGMLRHGSAPGGACVAGGARWARFSGDVAAS